MCLLLTTVFSTYPVTSIQIPLCEVMYLGSYLALSLDKWIFCSQNLFAQYICTFASRCDINNNSTVNSTLSVSSVRVSLCVVHLISVELLCDWFVTAGRNEKPFGNLQNMTVNLLVMPFSESFCSLLLAFILNKWLSCHHIWCHIFKSQMWLQAHIMTERTEGMFGHLLSKETFKMTLLFTSHVYCSRVNTPGLYIYITFILHSITLYLRA